MTVGRAVEKSRQTTNQTTHSVPPTTSSPSSKKRQRDWEEKNLPVNSEPSFFNREVLEATKISPHPNSKTPRSLKCPSLGIRDPTAGAEDSPRWPRETRNWVLCIPMTLWLMPRNPQNLFLRGQESNKGIREGLRQVDKLREIPRSRWQGPGAGAWELVPDPRLG